MIHRFMILSKYFQVRKVVSKRALFDLNKHSFKYIFRYFRKIKRNSKLQRGAERNEKNKRKYIEIKKHLTSCTKIIEIRI